MKTKVLKTKKDFYNFFKAIPAKQWTRHAMTNHGRHCALGHLGERQDTDSFDDTPNGRNLKKIGGDGQALVKANDFGFYDDLDLEDEEYKPYRTIKDNVLAYIKSL